MASRCAAGITSQPRQEIDPQQQIGDYRDAITYAATLPETDSARIGIWGSSYSGGHVLVVGAIDRRVKCVVAQVPLISGHANARRLIRVDAFAGLRLVRPASGSRLRSRTATCSPTLGARKRWSGIGLGRASGPAGSRSLDEPIGTG